MSRPLIVAHRGASTVAPENTMAAFRAGIEAGAEGVEFDVRLTKDGVPVVFHDADLVRIAEIRKKVADLTAGELAGIDVGSWFARFQTSRRRTVSGSPQNFAAEDFSEQSIPTVADVLELFKNLSGPVYVELKCDGPADAGPLADIACKAIEASGLPTSRIIVKSFELSTLPLVRKFLPEAAAAALFSPKLIDLVRRVDLVGMARRFEATHLSLHRSLANARIVERANKAGMPVTAWTVDSPSWLAHRIDIGLYAVITNDPARMLAEI